MAEKKKPFKKQIVAHRSPPRTDMFRDSLAGLRRDFDEFRESIEERIANLEEQVRELRDLMAELERNAE